MRQSQHPALRQDADAGLASCFLFTEYRALADGLGDALAVAGYLVASSSRHRDALHWCANASGEGAVLLVDVDAPASWLVVRGVPASDRARVRLVLVNLDNTAAGLRHWAPANPHGCATKNTKLAEIVTLIERVADGETVMSANAGPLLLRTVDSYRMVDDPEATILTRRESDILDFLRLGYSNKEIAAALNLQLSTVKNHVHRVLRKMGVNTRRQLAGVVFRGVPPHALEQDGRFELESPRTKKAKSTKNT